MAFDLILKRGALSQFIDLTLRDAATGQGKAGILPSEVSWYAVPRSTNNANVGNCAAMPGIWVSAGWKERDSVGAPGLYRFGVPNAVLSEGDSVTLRFRVTGCIDKEVKILLVAADLQDADKLGLGYLNAAVGGIPAAVWTNGAALKAADVWGHGQRSLTDKSGFVLSSTQAYDNSGQVALLPVNVQQWQGAAVQTSDDIPMVHVQSVSEGAATSIAGYTWNRLLSDVSVAGSIGLLVKDTLSNLGGLIEIDGTLPRFTAKAMKLAPGAAEVWSHPDRALTDKAGFSLASAQSFNNTGQTSILPANTKEWAGAQVALHEGSWPIVYMGAMESSLASSIGISTWNVLALLPEPGTYGALLVNNLDAKISTRSTLTAVNVWTHSDRSLTDKSGFSLSSTQAFNNTGQTALVPVNVKQFEGNAVQISAGLPQVEVKAVEAGTLAGMASAVWNYDLNGVAAGAGYLLRSRLDAQVSSIGGGSLSAADVWAYADRSLTDKSGFSLATGSISSSTFSPGAIDISVAPYLDAPISGMGLTAADVWAYADRTITGGTLGFRTIVREEADWALQAYDPPTRTELALDRDQILTQVQTSLAGIGQAPSAALIAAEVDAVLSAAHGAGAWVDQSRGTGPIDVQVSVRDAQGSPIALASVRLCVGPLGLSQQTDAFGNAVFSVEAGTYRVTAAKLGFSSAEAQLAVSGNNPSEAISLALNALASIPPQAEADKTTGYLTTYDAMGNTTGGVEIQFRLVAPPAGAASSYSAKRFTQVSDANGLVTVKLLKHAAYELRREAGEWVFFRTDDRDTYPLPTV